MTLLIANWKMAPDKALIATALAKDTLVLARKYKKSTQIIVCPSFIHLAAVAKVAKAPLTLGAQTVSDTNDIAQTGSINAAQLKDMGVQYVIVGHSEARARGDSNEMVTAQTLRLIEKKITPIVCVGEKDRDLHGWYVSVIKDQIDLLLNAIPKNIFKTIIIAYEPVWAIGKDAAREATAVECQEMMIYIRKLISDTHGDKIASSVRVIYGGSVTESNAKQFITEGTAQGLLVGRASLDKKRFELLAQAIQ